MKERWKAVIGFEGYYEVSNLGRCRSLGCWRINKWQRRWFKPKLLKTNSKYGSVFRLFGANGKKLIIQLHRLVALHFVPNPKHLPFSCHKDDNTKNNKASNLVWGNHKSNGQDALRNGKLKPPHGEAAKRSKLTEIKVRKIICLYQPWSRGQFGARALALQFGVRRGTIVNIIRGRAWKHVER